MVTPMLVYKDFGHLSCNLCERVMHLQSCAIVGSSGSGKSTLLRILMRLYDVQSGAVKLEGLDVRDLQQESLRSSVAVVPQETVLFNDT